MSTIERDTTAKTVVGKEYVFMEDKRRIIQTVEALKYVNTKNRRSIVKTVSESRK